MTADRPGAPFAPARGVTQLMYVGDDGTPSSSTNGLVVIAAVIGGVLLADMLLGRKRR